MSTDAHVTSRSVIEKLHRRFVKIESNSFHIHVSVWYGPSLDIRAFKAFIIQFWWTQMHFIPHLIVCRHEECFPCRVLMEISSRPSIRVALPCFLPKGKCKIFSSTPRVFDASSLMRCCAYQKLVWIHASPAGKFKRWYGLNDPKNVKSLSSQLITPFLWVFFEVLFSAMRMFAQDITPDELTRKKRAKASLKFLKSIFISEIENKICMRKKLRWIGFVVKLRDTVFRYSGPIT